MGAVATFIVLCVFIATKFIHGAWIVVVVVPLLVFMFRAIHKHYVGVAKQLSTEGLGELRPIKHTVIVPISGIHRGVVRRAAICQIDRSGSCPGCVCGF